MGWFTSAVQKWCVSKWFTLHFFIFDAVYSQLQNIGQPVKKQENSELVVDNNKKKRLLQIHNKQNTVRRT